MIHAAFPESRLLVSSEATLITTDAWSGERIHQHGQITIIERLNETSETYRYLLNLLGGPTGYESFYITDTNRFAEMGRTGWSACAGTPGKWNACFVTPLSMKTAFDEFFRAYLQGPRIAYPVSPSPDESRYRLEEAKERFIQSLRLKRGDIAQA
jgi:hypothetical protein